MFFFPSPRFLDSTLRGHYGDKRIKETWKRTAAKSHRAGGFYDPASSLTAAAHDPAEACSFTPAPTTPDPDSQPLVDGLREYRTGKNARLMISISFWTATGEEQVHQSLYHGPGREAVLYVDVGRRRLYLPDAGVPKDDGGGAAAPDVVCYGPILDDESDDHYPIGGVALELATEPMLDYWLKRFLMAGAALKRCELV